MTSTGATTSSATRTERDSMGEMTVPADALYGASTARAVENFPISGEALPRSVLRALGLIKAAAARVNADDGQLDPDMASEIERAALEVSAGDWDEHFPIDVYQTGSGTSTNMNANEVIANLAVRHTDGAVHPHPNDHINMGQSSNDVIPTTIHVAAYLEIAEQLIPALTHLEEALTRRAEETMTVVKTGRTHLMDATPIRLGQEISGWAAQVRHARERIVSSLPRLAKLAIGGTAVGTGVNTRADFGAHVAAELARRTGLPFVETDNHFEAQATQDTACEISGQLKTYAVGLLKIANDLRLMNSGPIAGFAEITLPALQPGSSIMPGKINPVIPEATMMVCARVIGNDTTITTAAQLGNFELNVMLPVIADSLLESIELLASVSNVLADKAIAGFTVNEGHIAELLERNPILITSLNPLIGYEQGAKIAKRAYAEGRSVRQVAAEMTDLSAEELDRALSPAALTHPGSAE